MDSSFLEVLDHPKDEDGLQHPQGTTCAQEPALGAPTTVGLQELVSS